MRRRLLAGALIYLAVAGCRPRECALQMPPVTDPGTLKLPPGLTAEVVVSGLSQPTQLQFDGAGRLFVLEGGGGAAKLLRLYDPSFVEQPFSFIDTYNESTGLLVLSGQEVLVASRGRIDRFRDTGAGGFVGPEPWIAGLPSSGEHTNNGMALGPDGYVYFSVGSTCDACIEVDPRSATIMRALASDPAPVPEIVATGIRNAYDVAFTPEGELLATDNGPECCGDSGSTCSTPGIDRLLAVRSGEDYGWPEGGEALARRALAALPLHAGATGLVVSDGTLLCAPGGTVFVALWGTQHGDVESGRRVVRIPLRRDAGGALETSVAEEILGPDGLTHPIDVAAGPDGALYILDFEGSVVRIGRTAPGPCP